MPSTFPKRVLRAALFDALKAAADKFGGIGAGTFYTDYDRKTNTTPSTPHCLIGFLHYLGLAPLPAGEQHDIVHLHGVGSDKARELFGFGWNSSDIAVLAINAQLGTTPIDRWNTPTTKYPRVPFEKWAEYLNIHRAVELAPNVYDALEASAAKFGGIGADAFDAESFAIGDGGVRVPYCVAGHAAFHDTAGRDLVPSSDSPMLVVLQKAFNVPFYYKVYDVNDAAVFAINERKGADDISRVSFAEWTKELNVVRGDA